MTLKNNFEYWEISLKYPEVKDDPYYINDDIIIDNDMFIEKVNNLRNLIKDFCSANDDKRLELLDLIFDLIGSTDNIQFHEFIAFWKAYDFTFSIYKSINSTKKKIKLRDLLEKYCNRRLNKYDKTSNVVIQALYDSSVSRKSQSAALKKIVDMINNEFKTSSKAVSLIDFETKETCYCKTSSETYNDIFLKNKFSDELKEKRPYLLLKVKDNFLLINLYHVKETGGSQNPKIEKLIKFIEISQEQGNLFLISFIDGYYFNKLTEPNISGKILEHKKAIKENLKNYKNSYFVNTAGLKELLGDLKTL